LSFVDTAANIIINHVHESKYYFRMMGYSYTYIPIKR